MDCLTAYIELENTRNHNDCLWVISILKHCELESFRTIDEKATAEASLILDHPVPSAVPTDEEL